MPVALIVFGDKSHTDLHGALSITPVLFTLNMFNRTFRNNSNAWRPLAYIPNLSYGKNKANRQLVIIHANNRRLEAHGYAEDIVVLPASG